MKSFKVLPMVLTGILLSSSLVLAADPGTKTGTSQAYDKYGKPLPGTQTSINPPVTAIPKTETGNTVSSGSVTVQPPPRRLCSDYNPADPDIVLARGGRCPAGYICSSVEGTNGNLYNCKKIIDPGQPLYADDFYCSTRSCYTH